MSSSRPYQAHMQTFETSFQVSLPPAIKHQKPVIFRKGDLEEMHQRLSKRLFLWATCRLGKPQKTLLFLSLRAAIWYRLVRQLNWIIDQISVDRTFSTHCMNSGGENMVSVHRDSHRFVVACIASEQQNTIIYEDQDLKILAMAWLWTFANELDRYRKHDPLDLVSLLWALNTKTASLTWLWQWIRANCDPWVVEWTSREVVNKIQGRIKDVATRLERWTVNGSPILDEDITIDDEGSDSNDSDDHEST
ncbi:hypothetical protein DFS33DRAFT_1387045 [Desarmillaria ectypa]|nr:hypothetical protein DFS33DRAFT_1387045 [Desarmillaria ectypa]